MLGELTRRLVTEVDPRGVWKFIHLFGWKGMRAVQRFNQRKRRGDDAFPAFIVVSVTDRCNLRCQGCWVTPCDPPRELSVERLDAIIDECERHGSFFFGLLGGEPLLHPRLFDVMANHPKSYFQVFTNGTLLDDSTAAAMRELGNVTPLISVEGDASISDERRGGDDVFETTMRGVECCRKNKLVIGVATSVCRSNIDALVSERFIKELINRGVHYLWYYIYRPVGPDPNPDLALSEEQILRLRRFMVDARAKAPIVIIDAYWDHEGNALCPAATGFSHHIGPGGHLEFCPPMQFAKESLADGDSLTDLLADSTFLKRFRRFAVEHTRGCVLLECPDALGEFLKREDAEDSSGRNAAFAELAGMTPVPGHHIPGGEIRERHWAYRFAKKYWFFGFGAYG